MSQVSESTSSIIAQIGSCEESRVFTLKEARELLPVVKRITTMASQELEPVKHRIENMLATDPRLKAVEREYESVVRRWVRKMERLGLVVNGLWMVNFDTGDGYLCWQHPETRIAWFHDYSAGVADKRALQDVIDETMPDWAQA